MVERLRDQKSNNNASYTIVEVTAFWSRELEFLLDDPQDCLLARRIADYACPPPSLNHWMMAVAMYESDHGLSDNESSRLVVINETLRAHLIPHCVSVRMSFVVFSRMREIAKWDLDDGAIRVLRRWFRRLCEPHNEPEPDGKLMYRNVIDIARAIEHLHAEEYGLQWLLGHRSDAFAREAARQGGDVKAGRAIELLCRYSDGRDAGQRIGSWAERAAAGRGVRALDRDAITLTAQPYQRVVRFVPTHEEASQTPQKHHFISKAAPQRERRQLPCTWSQREQIDATQPLNVSLPSSTQNSVYRARQRLRARQALMGEWLFMTFAPFAVCSRSRSIFAWAECAHDFP